MALEAPKPDWGWGWGEIQFWINLKLESTSRAGSSSLGPAADFSRRRSASPLTHPRAEERWRGVLADITSDASRFGNQR